MAAARKQAEKAPEQVPVDEAEDTSEDTPELDITEPGEGVTAEEEAAQAAPPPDESATDVKSYVANLPDKPAQLKPLIEALVSQRNELRTQCDLQEAELENTRPAHDNLQRMQSKVDEYQRLDESQLRVLPYLSDDAMTVRVGEIGSPEGVNEASKAVGLLIKVEDADGACIGTHVLPGNFQIYTNADGVTTYVRKLF